MAIEIYGWFFSFPPCCGSARAERSVPCVKPGRGDTMLGRDKIREGKCGVSSSGDRRSLSVISQFCHLHSF